MDTSALKSFAQEARRQLLESVERKLDYVLTADTPDLRAASAQVQRLRTQAEASRAQLVERVAYTWFNRLAALRFLDARGWHPFKARVLTAASSAETQPEILKLVRSGVLPGELKAHADPTRLNDLLGGRLPSFEPQGEVYRHLVLAACRFYHALLPFLFERLDDETELLLPDDLLTVQSVAHGFRTEISDEDCEQVEILGWLYQFYISEKKDQVMARKGPVPSEDIPARTQLFTPHWIVRYLVENSLGRLWLQSRPGSALRGSMPYYVEDPDGQAPADSLTVSRPEEIRLLDPACGSGHMLTYAFDLLFQIYEEEGHAPADIPEKILTHNLYGLEICPRATQLAQFALLAKARERSQTAFQRAVRPQVMCLEDVPLEPDEVRVWLQATGLGHAFTGNVLQQLFQFRENMSTLGSLIQPVLAAEEITELTQVIAQAIEPTDLILQETQRKILLALNQAEMLTQRYHVVVTNPPYMGSYKFAGLLKSLAAKNFLEGKADLYSCFILRNSRFIERGGTCGMITWANWMFLGSWDELRGFVLRDLSLLSLIHIGRGIWGPDFGSCAFIFQNARQSAAPGFYKRLFERQGEVNSLEELERRFLDNEAWPPFWTPAERMLSIPGQPIAYWVSAAVASVFASAPSLSAFGSPRQGFATGDNERFLRRWPEVAYSSIGFNMRDRSEARVSGRTWFPCNKGGEYRKWFGNNEFLVDWKEDGLRMRSFPNSVLRNQSYYFRDGITWSTLTISRPSMRLSPPGHLFESKGSVCFFDSADDRDLFLSFGNSTLVERFLLALSPTADYSEGPVGRLPVRLGSEEQKRRLRAIAADSTSLARTDWNNFETSWDFKDLPLLRPELKGPTLEASWQNWRRYLEANIARMQQLETENNRLWIEVYGLQDELSAEVPEEEITLARPDKRKDVAAFLSYAVGCMMGRYSLDKPGLILADAGDTLENYLAKVGKRLEELTLVPDEDGIIPVLDADSFDDDIVARTRAFLCVTFGQETLAQNLRFIEEALGKDLRKYFVTDFYKDHLRTYRKRPIYWMFQSPKKGFQCLVYLHRYTRDTPNRVLNRCLREYLLKIRYRLEHLSYVLASESTSARDKTRARKEADQLDKTLRECETWEREVLLPLAQQRPELDLDDGVKVNYLKLGAALAPIPGLAAKEEE